MKNLNYESVTGFISIFLLVFVSIGFLWVLANNSIEQEKEEVLRLEKIEAKYQSEIINK